MFFDWRFNDDGSDNPEFELNQSVNQGASVLVAGRNFGSGSSREHAVWALADFGFRCVIAESYSDIFYNNCFKNGVLPIRLDGQHIKQLMDNKHQNDDYQLVIDLESQTIKDTNGLTIEFDIEQVRKTPLLNGHDDIALTLQLTEKIEAFEKARNMKPVATG